MFSSSASKIATKATENAIKIGGLATQKARIQISRKNLENKLIRD